MRHQLRLIFKSSNFVTGFIIFITVFLLAILFPAFSSVDPLKMIGGLFYKPGTYISVSDAIETEKYELSLDTISNKLAKNITKDEQNLMKEWLTKYCTAVTQQEIEAAQEPQAIIELWLNIMILI